MNIFNPYGTLSEIKDYNYLLLYLIVYFSCQINLLSMHLFWNN